MKVINFGSLNIDHVYSLKDFVKPGETVASIEYSTFCGGKGCNQSVALARAGQVVSHAGVIGKDGTWLREVLTESGVDTSFVRVGAEATGHAIIQVSQDGENSIIIHGGANNSFDSDFVTKVLESANPGDYVLTQNETNCVPEILSLSAARGLNVVFNPAPMTAEVDGYPLNDVDFFIVNESEGMALTKEKTPDKILDTLLRRFPKSNIVLTLGDKGAVFQNAEEKIAVESLSVKTVDTTAAGDTFIGYFLSELARCKPVKDCLEFACQAAAICVQSSGATSSIPKRHDVIALNS